MSKAYQKKTNRSRRKLQKLDEQAVKVEVGPGRATFQMILPMDSLLTEVADSIEQMACQAGLLMMKAMIDEEVEQVAGPKGLHNEQLPGYRWGKEEGHTVFMGRKVAIEKPRVRSKKGGEIPLRRYQAFRHPQRMARAVQEKILRRVSTRDYEGVIGDLCEGYGIQRSSVSRHWQAASTRQLQEVLEKDLSQLGIAVVILDGKVFHDYTLIAAIGVDWEGRKHVLGLWPGATENAEVCGALLDHLIERGLSPQENYLFILDGSKALKKAVTTRFGPTALIQRCRVHKENNVKSHLAPEHHKLLSLKLKAAWGTTDPLQARKALQKVHDWLATINLAAARSLEEGLEETLTVNQLQLPPMLHQIFCCTNIIESAFSRTEDLCRNVKRWRNANMAWRWAGTVLREAQGRFHRIRGYREMPVLLRALKKTIATEQSVA